MRLFDDIELQFVSGWICRGDEVIAPYRLDGG